MAKDITFTAERINEDETTIILFNCNVSSQLKTVEEAKTAISTAVKKWTQESPTGKAVLEQNNGDFNFGDLAILAQDLSSDLPVFLNNAGIYEVNSQTLSGEVAFSLDENLSL